MLIIGGGVAGLAAAGPAKNMGANVTGFDVREAALKDFESMRCKTIRVKVTEDGEGGGGYAKEMGDEFKKAQYELFLKEIPNMDIVITTALIPGKPAPKLISSEMIERKRQGCWKSVDKRRSRYSEGRNDKEVRLYLLLL